MRLRLRFNAWFAPVACAAVLCGSAVAGQAGGAKEKLSLGREAWARGDALSSQIEDLRRAGKLTDAIRAEKAEGMTAAYQQAEKLLAEAAAELPGEGAGALGEFLHGRKRFREAREALEKAIAAVKIPEAAGQERDAAAGVAGRLHRLCGSAWERAGKADAALKHYREALKLDPKDAVAAEYAAVALAFAGDFDSAVGMIERFDPGPPSRPLVDYTRGLCLECVYRSDEALAAYRRAGEAAKALNQDELAGFCADAVARVEGFLKKTDKKAWEKIEEACALLRNGERLLAEAGEDKTKAAAAAQAFKSAVSRWPSLALAHYRLGTLYLSEEKCAAAKTHFEAATLYEPQQPAYLKGLAQALLMLGQFDEAIRALGRLLLLDPESGPAHFGLARAHGMLRATPRDIEVALMDLDRADQLGVDVPPPMRGQFAKLLEELRAAGAEERKPPSPPKRGPRDKPDAPAPPKGQGDPDK